MSFQKPRAALGELVVGLLITFLWTCQSRSLNPAALTTEDTSGMDFFRTSQVPPPVRRKGWLFPCLRYGLLWPGITGNTSGGLLFPQHRVLTMAKIKIFGTKDGILAFSTCGSCISSLFGPFMLSSSAATFVSVLSCPCFIFTANCEGQETGGGSTGRLMPSYSLHPFLERWHWTTHSDGVNTTQGSSSWIEIAGTLTVVTSLRKERWCGTGLFIFSMTGNISTPVISTNMVCTYHALQLAILHVGTTGIKNARVLLLPSTEQAQNAAKLNPLLFFASSKAFSCSVYHVIAHGCISLLSKGSWSPRASHK